MAKRHSGMVLAAALLLAGCGFEAPPPVRTTPPPEPKPPLSTLSVTLAVPASEIAALLNRETAAHIAELHDQKVKCGIGRCKLSLEAVRTGAITVEARDDRLQIGVPFWVTAEMSLPGFLSSVRATANAQGVADAATEAVLTPDWRIRSTTRGTIRVDSSHLRLGPVVTNLADIWNDNEDTLSRPLFKMLDKQISNGIREQPKIIKLWARAFRPIKIGKKPVAWLLLQPERLRVGRPVTENGAYLLSLGLDARARVIVQDAPPQTTPTRLPPPAPLQERDSRFAVAVPVLLPYGRAAELALQSLKKKPPHVAGMAVQFDKLDILPSGQDVVIAAHFCVAQGWWDPFHWFAACGTGYLRGAPLFDPATATVRITHVHYDIATESVLLGVARALAGPALGSALEGRLIFPAGREIAKLQSQVAAAIAKPQGRDVTVSGEMDSFGTPSLTWTKDGFLASFSAEGRIRAELHL